MAKSVTDDPRLAEQPPLARMLGRQVVSASDDGEVELQFEGTDAFTNRFGLIQGGFLSTMLDSALGIAVLITLPQGQFPVTVSMNVAYFEPAKPGKLRARARISAASRPSFLLAPAPPTRSRASTERSGAAATRPG